MVAIAVMIGFGSKGSGGGDMMVGVDMYALTHKQRKGRVTMYDRGVTGSLDEVQCVVVMNIITFVFVILVALNPL
jgi:hypothetical protein